jgi:hypothetical protein
MRRRIGSNAVANIASGITLAGFQVAMTAIVARSGDGRGMPVWSLAASIAGFVPLLSCNVAAAVARRLNAHASVEGQGTPAVNESAVIAAAQRLSNRLTLLGLALAVAVAFAAPWIYPALLQSAPLSSALLIGGFFAGSCWVVQSQPAQGWLMTAHRNWSISAANLLSRAAALAVCAAALLLALMPLWAGVLLAAAAMWSGAWLMRRLTPLRTSMPRPRPQDLVEEQRQMWLIARAFGVWGLTSAATQACTVPVVALVAPELAAPFFLSFTLVNVLIGGVTATSNALIAPLARLLGSDAHASAARAAAHATWVLWSMFTLLALVVYACLGPLLHAWTGHLPAQFDAIKLCFVLLALQHGLRCTAMIPAVVLSMGASTSTMIVSPLIEAAAVALIALPLAIWCGPFAFVVGLAIAGGLGALAVVGLAARHALRVDFRSAEGRMLPLTAASLQAAGIVVWGCLAWAQGRPA